MAATGTLKVLTVGPAIGALRDLFAKVKAIDAKHGKFDLVLCVGDFFGPISEDGDVSEEVNDLLEGRIEVPVECYITQGEHPLPNVVIDKFAKTGGDLCKNVFLLSKSAIVTTAHGLRIACLGGDYDPSAYATSETALGFTSPYFSRQTVDKLLANTAAKSSVTKSKDYTSLAAITAGVASSQLVDILVSHTWPSSITQLSSLPSPELTSSGAAPLDVVVRHTKPRYHLTPGIGQPRIFWEREPFVWDDEQGRVSRFVSLGSFGGETGTGKKQRWFYAFSIAPVAPNAPTVPRPVNATSNPFTEMLPGQKRAHDASDGGESFRWGNVPQAGKRAKTGGEQGKPPPGYQCKRCESTEHFINDCPERVKPPENYICKICNEPGHFVRDCPTKHQVGDTGGRKPRPGYVCRACGSEAHYIEDCPSARAHAPSERRRGPPREIQPDECWFCLSNPRLAKHLIVAVGNECYVTLPKGQIHVTHGDGATPLVPGGGHVLIVPIAHYPTLASLAPDIGGSVLEEVAQHKRALSALFAKQGAVPVFIETARISAKGGHAHVQAVPIPRAMAGRVREEFERAGKVQGIEFAEDVQGALEACASGTRSYFRVDLPDGEKMVAVLRDGVHFNLQFGRMVMTTLLDVPDRFDWKACAQSEDEDKEDAAAFKAAFAPFDTSS